jgi:high-affinity nickel-transport protein
MVSIAMILVLGFVLGMRHATDPDHVVAITTIVAKQHGIAKAGLIGALWGLGHTVTIFVVGASIILFGVTIPPRVGLSMEFAVAFMLILLGILNLTGTLRHLQERFLGNSFSLGAGGTQPTDNGVGAVGTLGAYNALRPLIIGIVHGLAGSAAIALLVMTTIRDPWWAIAYLLLFGSGTVAGMILITALIAMPIVWSQGKFSSWNRGMTVMSGLISLSFGFFLTYRIAIVDGLFSNHPQWTPH